MNYGKILIVDTQVPARRDFDTVLSQLSFDISMAGSPEEAISMVRAFRYDAVLLDIAWPEMAGIETCQRLRKIRPQLGIVVLAAENTETTIIDALDAGADDYVVKPFHFGELAARLRSVIRRSRTPDESRGPVLAIGEVELDPNRRIVTRAGREIRLTPKEFDLLRYLMTNAGFPVPHSRLLGAVWGSEYGNEVEYLRTFVRQLRKKLGDHATEPQYLITIPHVGYRFRAPREIADGNDLQLAGSRRS